MRTERHVKSVVEGLLKRIEGKARTKTAPVIEAWKQLKNEDLKKHAKVINLKRGTLIVKVENSAWLYRFTIEKGKIIKEFNEHYKNRRKIKEIRFRVGSLEEE